MEANGNQQLHILLLFFFIYFFIYVTAKKQKKETHTGLGNLEGLEKFMCYRNYRKYKFPNRKLDMNGLSSHIYYFEIQK